MQRRTGQQWLLTWITRENPTAARLLQGKRPWSHPGKPGSLRGGCDLAKMRGGFAKWFLKFVVAR